MTAQTFAFARNQLRTAVERRRAREPRPSPTLDKMAELYIKLQRFMVVDGLSDKARNLRGAEDQLRAGVVPLFARPDCRGAPPRGFRYGSYFTHVVRWRPKQPASPGQSTTRPLLFCEFLAAYDYPAGSASVQQTADADISDKAYQLRIVNAKLYLHSIGRR